MAQKPAVRPRPAASGVSEGASVAGEAEGRRSGCAAALSADATVLCCRAAVDHTLRPREHDEALAAVLNSPPARPRRCLGHRVIARLAFPQSKSSSCHRSELTEREQPCQQQASLNSMGDNSRDGAADSAGAAQSSETGERADCGQSADCVLASLLADELQGICRSRDRRS